MTPEQFRQWLKAMKTADIAASDAACSELLDVTPNTIVNMKERGCDRRTALACAALLNGVEPYGD